MITIAFEAHCPFCGATQRTLAVRGLDLDTLAAAGFAPVRAPRDDEPLRILEDRPCGEHGIFTEVSIVRGAIVELRAVELDLAELARLHAIPPATGMFARWLATVFDPTDGWSPAVTRDRARALWLVLRCREPIPAHNRLEAWLFAMSIGGLPVGDITCVDAATRRWVVSCTTKSLRTPRVDLSFILADDREQAFLYAFPSEPSTLVPPETLLAAARVFAERAPVYPYDLSPMDRHAVRSALAQAVEILVRLVATIPPDDEVVPEAAFWGDQGREYRVTRRDRYTRARLEGTIERWRADLAHLDTVPRGRARSVVEAHVYMDLHPCPACEHATGYLASQLVADGDDLVSIYEGTCPGCKRRRHFEMVIVDPFEPPATPQAVVIGDGVSTLLDAGQFLLAAERFAKQVPADATGLDARARSTRTDRLRMAIGAIDEALKFVPTGADAVPASAIRSRAGWALYDLEPGRFRRDRMTAVRGAFVGLLPT